MQRAAFSQNAVAILSRFARDTAVREAAVALQTGRGSSYGHGDRSPALAGHSAGQSDGSGDLLADLLADAAARAGGGQALAAPPPDELPSLASPTDAPSVWSQASRSLGQWDGSVLAPFWRNIAAQLPIVGDPGAMTFRTPLSPAIT
ncbi:hypothetical protein H5395_06860 [Paracoccus sp. MC1854]|uniref:hypothetical protein n=1 Tax=Paracoccus sp. MC1854 TaxID=2760306 RepID=UPI001600AED2|nr:hypothetical protein [Paracoccus sp. MC1854]MBB1491255.1 hypothetical protein [Paracoccus sp. MC1854]